MKKIMSKFLAVIIVLAFSLSQLSSYTYSASSPQVFSDIVSRYLAEKGFAKVFGSNVMEHPYITKEDFLVILSQIFNKGSVTKNFKTVNLTYTDVQKDNKYAPYVAWAKSSGIINDNQKTFGIGKPLTAYQAKYFLVRALGYTDVSEDKINEKANTLGITGSSNLDYSIGSITPIPPRMALSLIYSTLMAVGPDGKVLGEKLKILDDSLESWGYPNSSVYKGDWVYFANETYYSKLYKVKLNGTERVKLSDDSASFLQISGDWLYYKNTSDGDKLYRIRLDGTQRQKLTDEPSNGFVYQPNDYKIIGEWIYFVSPSETGYKYFKVKTDGTNKTEINFYPEKIEGDWAYYFNYHIYKAKMDGTQNNIIVVRNTKTFNELNLITVKDGWIYYVVYKYNAYYELTSTLYKVRVDGTSKTKLVDNYDYNFFEPFEFSDALYFHKLNDQALYKLKFGETKESKILDIAQQVFRIDNDWIYYQFNDRVCKAKLDGTQITSLATININANIRDIDENRIIYSVSTQNYAQLFKLSLDGKNKSKLLKFKNPLFDHDRPTIP